MFYDLLKYDEPVFRPPSEAYSLILQTTIGCSWNRCAFCEMYTTKKFRIRPAGEIKAEIQLVSGKEQGIRKVFLADGNSMIMPVPQMLEILETLSGSFPNLTRVSAYASSSDLKNKSIDELKLLRDNGLKLLYIGIETGSDELLKAVNKNDTASEIIESLNKAKEAGIKLSVMIINGLGGKVFSERHALESARAVNDIQPQFLSTLVLSFPFGVDHYKKKFRGSFEPLNKIQLLEELKLFLSATNLEASVFRSDHASNYLSLKGILNRDKEDLIKRIDFALANPLPGILRQEWQRGL